MKRIMTAAGLVFLLAMMTGVPAQAETSLFHVPSGATGTVSDSIDADSSLVEGALVYDGPADFELHAASIHFP
jgi:adenosylcobinamide amidohydrolase